VSGTLLLCHKSKYSTTHWYIIAPPFSHLLGEKARTEETAKKIYARCWGDGPPHIDYSGLKIIRSILKEAGIPEPQLPVRTPADIAKKDQLYRELGKKVKRVIDEKKATNARKQK